MIEGASGGLLNDDGEAAKDKVPAFGPLDETFNRSSVCVEDPLVESRERSSSTIDDVEA